MDDVVSDLRDQHLELDTLLASLAASDWDRPTRCEGWSVADVVLHLSQTDEMALASLTDSYAETFSRLTGGTLGRDIDEGAANMVDGHRGAPGAEVHAKWRAGAAELQAALASRDGHDRVQWVVGTLSVQTLATTRLAEA
ncbi:MAG TPA: maleylpyruvate isomerase N-terminal domain-containing protein [Acidimicrobiales bacterium]|nr:maleylpyruvate isomerase N-terminal domain-containing protein [Acidimicrobiales bacterium]